MSSLRANLPVLVIILIGFALRIHDLQAVPLRGDEAFSAQYWSDLPLAQSLVQIAPIDPHPPLTFALFRSWRLVLGGIESVFALRFLSALGNTIGIPAMYALAIVVAGGRRAGLIAALIWALHPYEIWHSHDYRNYAVWAGISAVSLWLGLRLIHRRQPKDWLLYATAALGAGLIYYAELFNLLALSCLALLMARRQRQFIFRFLILQAGVGLAAIVAFALIQARSDFFGAYGGNLEAFAAADYLKRIVPTLTFGDYFNLRLASFWPVVSLLYLAAILIVLKTSRRQLGSLTLLICLPLLLLGLVSQSRDVFNPRYILNTVPALILLLTLAACGAAELLRNLIPVNRRVLAICVLSPWFALAGVAIDAYFNDSSLEKSPAWDELGRFLSQRVTGDDLVIQLSVDPAFAYYYAGDAPEMALPAHPAQREDEIIATLESLRESFDTVYVVSREQDGWGNAGVVQAWMSENLQEVMRTHVAGLPVRQYADWPAASDFTSGLARFADTVALQGYQFFRAPLPTGEQLLWIYWKPLSRAARSLKSFAHVYGDFNRDLGSTLWAQADQFPQGGRVDSTSWKVNDVFRDVYYLPTQDLANGEYRIGVGWYDPASGARLSLMDGANTFDLESFHFSVLNRNESH